MSDARRRLRLVTDAAYATEVAAAHHRHDTDTAHELHDTDAAEDSHDTDAPQRGDAQYGGILEVERPRSTPAKPEVSPGHRWGTPVLLAARLGVIVLLVAVAAAVTIIVTRPSAPAHQPELAWPDPPQEWPGGGVSAPDAPGSGGSRVPGGDPGESAESEDPSAASDPPHVDGAVDSGAGREEGEQQAAQDAVVVHVAGQVHDPGIVELPGRARVHQALTAAGGPAPEADLAALNLAAPVSDGQQIYVPAHGEEPRTPPAGSVPSGTGGSGGSAGHGGSGGDRHADNAGGPVDINTADAATLQNLPGIGPALAERILTHRDQHGPFTAVDDLMAVSGIGPATLTRLRDQVVV